MWTLTTPVCSLPHLSFLSFLLFLKKFFDSAQRGDTKESKKSCKNISGMPDSMLKQQQEWRQKGDPSPFLGPL
jgi:hypothetical protein